MWELKPYVQNFQFRIYNIYKFSQTRPGPAPVLKKTTEPGPGPAPVFWILPEPGSGPGKKHSLPGAKPGLWWNIHRP